jgi:hypothetical protein
VLGPFGHTRKNEIFAINDNKHTYTHKSVDARASLTFVADGVWVLIKWKDKCVLNKIDLYITILCKL